MLGSMQSQRVLRVYNQRGYNRVEMMARAERADIIAADLAVTQVNRWYQIAISHVLDFIDIDNSSAWDDLKKGHKRAGRKLESAEEMTMQRLHSWIEHQVAPSLSVLVDLYGMEELEAILEIGRNHKTTRMRRLLESKLQERRDIQVGWGGAA